MGDVENAGGRILLILRGRAFRALAAAALVSVTLATTALSGLAPASAATAGPSEASTKGLAYVALGDSYAAGYGLSDPTDEPVAGCSQSARDYPHRVAESLGLDLTDVSCSGATTANVVDTSQLGAPPQVDALGSRTRVVTVSIGGNDANLFGTASSCISLGRDGPVFNATATTRSCKQTLDSGGVDTLTRAIDTTTARGLDAAFSAISAKAPNARVFVVGYPAIFPDRAHTPSGGCFRPVIDGASLAEGLPRNGFPFTDTDVAYLAGVQSHFDTVVAKAASRAGFTFVDTLSASQAHSGCATRDSYIQGVSLEATDGFRKISLETGALHPTELGTAFLAGQTAAAIRASFAASASASASAAAGPDVKAFVLNVPWPIGVLLLVLVLVVVLALLLRARRRRRAAQEESPERSPDDGPHIDR